MKKYHVNNNDEVKLCRANKKLCKFGGADGTKNHFFSKEEAERYALEKCQKKYGDTSMVSHRRSNSGSSLQTLSNKGVRVERIRSVETHNFSRGNLLNSSVDIVVEKPTQDMLNDIRAGKFSFHNL